MRGICITVPLAKLREAFLQSFLLLFRVLGLAAGDRFTLGKVHKVWLLPGQLFVPQLGEGWVHYWRQRRLPAE
jgi:hypothetical protein